MHTSKGTLLTFHILPRRFAVRIKYMFVANLVLAFAASVPAQLVDQGAQEINKGVISDQDWSSL